MQSNVNVSQQTNFYLTHRFVRDSSSLLLSRTKWKHKLCHLLLVEHCFCNLSNFYGDLLVRPSYLGSITILNTMQFWTIIHLSRECIIPFFYRDPVHSPSHSTKTVIYRKTHSMVSLACHQFDRANRERVDRSLKSQHWWFFHKWKWMCHLPCAGTNRDEAMQFFEEGFCIHQFNIHNVLIYSA